jgi:hypothetical protein
LRKEGKIRAKENKMDPRAKGVIQRALETKKSKVKVRRDLQVKFKSNKKAKSQS